MRRSLLIEASCVGCLLFVSVSQAAAKAGAEMDSGSAAGTIAFYAPSSIADCAGATSGPGPGEPSAPCATIDIAGEVFDPPLPQPAPKGTRIKTNTFYGYSDPSIRTDPNGSGYTYLAYSYAIPATGSHVAYGLHVIEIELAHSGDGGLTWTKDGTLFESTPFNSTPASPPLATWDVTSHETVDLLPFNNNGTTLWVQAHQEYLVDASGKKNLEGQQAYTNFISVTAAIGVTPTDLLNLGNAQTGTGQTGVPEARLGNAYTNAAIPVTQNLSALPSDVNHAAADCDSWSQQTMFQQGDKLYLAAQCVQSNQGKVDQNDWAFFVFSTQPFSDDPSVSPTDASTWPWTFEGVIATQANAKALWRAENSMVKAFDPTATAYTAFTEMQFAMSSDGVHPLAILSPSQFSVKGGQSQPVKQYGCRVVPVTFAPLGLDLSGPNGAPNSIAATTESDLYTSPNEGPGACAYEPLSSNGLLMVHKVEGSPHWSTMFETFLKP